MIEIRAGMELVAHAGRNSRCWLVRGQPRPGLWELVPAPDEPLQVHVIRRTTEDLQPPHWHEREIFPAPRKDDCSYGCCKAGDVGLFSEVTRVSV